MGTITLRSRDIDSEYIYANWCAFLDPNTAAALDGNEMLAFIRGSRPPADPQTFFLWQTCTTPTARTGPLGPVRSVSDGGPMSSRCMPDRAPATQRPAFALPAPPGARREHRSP